MTVKEIQEYAQIRTKARAYLCYIMSRNIPSEVDSCSQDEIQVLLQKIQDAIPSAEVVYAIDGNGTQITENVSRNPKLLGKGKGRDRSDRAYYYKTRKEHRCKLTDPYPSLLTNELVVTASYPFYDAEGKLLAIICADISLKNILKMVHPTSSDSTFGNIAKGIYTIFSIALLGIAALLFIKGISSIGLSLDEVDINTIFKATILLTLSLAIVDLVKAIFEEEVLGRENKRDRSDDSHQTMVKFLGSIIISLSIEALMLVFKFALTDPGQLLYAVYLLFGITGLIIALSIYLKVNKKQENSS
ncbi:MAG: hypothetical protein HF962_06890 [Sulfurovum sp.]|nr:hypothetical protein [Sulfurovum sp.]